MCQFLVSISLHVLLFFLLIFCFFAKTHRKNVIINAYLYSKNQNNFVQLRKKNNILQTKQKIPNNYEKNATYNTYKKLKTCKSAKNKNSKRASHKIVKLHTGKKILYNYKTTNSIKSYAERKKDVVKNLLSFLHNKIKNNIIYPQILSNFIIKKAVTVNFVLFPNGLIKNIKILKSSKNKLLDDAATDAIKSLKRINIKNMAIYKRIVLKITIYFADN